MYHIGVDLGGTNIAAGITDESFHVIQKGSVPTLPDRGSGAVLHDLAELCLDLMRKSDLTVNDFPYLGIAAPGIANQSTGIIEYNNNLGFIQVPITRIMKEKLGFQEVYLENDANAAALGEALAGAGRGADISIMITLGTGVGGGVVIQGRLLQGAHHIGGELGHIVIERRNGRRCTCGRIGCWEAYSSSTALVSRTKEMMQENTQSLMWNLCGGDLKRADSKTAFTARKMGDRTASVLIDEYMDDLACGLSNVINAFDPDVVCLGGGLSQQGQILLDLLIPRVGRETYGYQENKNEREKKRVKLAELGNEAGWIGAAWLRESRTK